MAENFSTLSKEYFNERFSRRLFANKNAYFKRYLFVINCLGIKSNELVVDIGCAQGGFLLACKQKGFRAYGIDFSIEALKMARKLSLRNVICADASAIPLKNGLFKNVIVLQILEIVPDMRLALSEIKRISGKDCKFYFEVRNGSFVFRRLNSLMSNLFFLKKNNNRFTFDSKDDYLYDDWISFFEKNGYNVSKVIKSPVYLYYENPIQFFKMIIIKWVSILLPAKRCFTFSCLCEIKTTENHENRPN